MNRRIPLEVFRANRRSILQGLGAAAVGLAGIDEADRVAGLRQRQREQAAHQAGAEHQHGRLRLDGFRHGDTPSGPENRQRLGAAG